MVKWIGDALRPDMSGVMVMLNLEAAPLSGIAERTALFTLLNRAALNAQGLAEAIAASVAVNVNTYLVVPTSPGFAPKRARLNEVLTDPVRRKDKTALLHVLKRVRSELLSEPMQAVVLQSHPEDPERPVRSD